MTDRFAELQSRVLRSRLALETMAESASRLRARLLEDVALRSSLDRLQKGARATSRGTEHAAGEADGHFISDAWEIALINEEGK